MPRLLIYFLVIFCTRSFSQDPPTDAQLIDWAVKSYSDILNDPEVQSRNIDATYFSVVRERNVHGVMRQAMLRGGRLAEQIVQAFCEIGDEFAVESLLLASDTEDEMVQSEAYGCLFVARHLVDTKKNDLLAHALAKGKKKSRMLAALYLQTRQPGGDNLALFRKALDDSDWEVAQLGLRFLETRDYGVLVNERKALMERWSKVNRFEILLDVSYQLYRLKVEVEPEHSFEALIEKAMLTRPPSDNQFILGRYGLSRSTSEKVRTSVLNYFIREFLRASEAGRPSPIEENVRYLTREDSLRKEMELMMLQFERAGTSQAFEVFRMALEHSNQYLSRAALLILSRHQTFSGSEIAKLMDIVLRKKPDAKSISDYEAWLRPLAQIFKEQESYPEVYEKFDEVFLIMTPNLRAAMVLNRAFDGSLSLEKRSVGSYLNDENWQVRLGAIASLILFPKEFDLNAKTIRGCLEAKDAYTQLVAAHALMLYRTELKATPEELKRALGIVFHAIKREDEPFLRAHAGRVFTQIVDGGVIEYVRLMLVLKDPVLVEPALDAIVIQKRTPITRGNLGYFTEMKDQWNRFLFAKSLLAQAGGTLPSREEILRRELRDWMSERVLPDSGFPKLELQLDVR